MSVITHPFLLGEKKKIVFFFPLLIKEIITLRKSGHFSTVLSWGVFLLLLFLYRAGATMTIILKSWHLNSIVLSLSTWFGWERKSDPAFLKWHSEETCDIYHILGQSIYQSKGHITQTQILQTSGSNLRKYRGHERRNIAGWGDITSKCNTESQTASQKQKGSSFFCVSHTSRWIWMKWAGYMVIPHKYRLPALLDLLLTFSSLCSG